MERNRIEKALCEWHSARKKSEGEFFEFCGGHLRFHWQYQDLTWTSTIKGLFTEDLNSMAFITDAMSDDEQCDYLIELCKTRPRAMTALWEAARVCALATASQRAEAACRALGLWEEEVKSEDEEVELNCPACGKLMPGRELIHWHNCAE